MNGLQPLTAATEPPVARMLYAMGRRLGTPVSGTFELTAGCNFNCRACYIHENGALPGMAGELTADQWLRIGRQAADAGTVFVTLTGGEPLSRPDFAGIYTGLKRLGMAVSVNTNGALLTGDIAALLEREPPMRLNVSLYADSPEGYRKHCGADAFNDVVANIRRMKAAGVSVKLNVLFCRDNADRCEQIAALVQELGLHCQASFYLYPPVRRKDPAVGTRLSPEEAAVLRVRWEKLRGGAEALRASADQPVGGRENGCGDAARAEEGVRCRAGHTSYWIDAAGKMMMCGMIPLRTGSVLEEGFARCWQNTRALMKTVSSPQKCVGCRLRPLCCVCPAACFAETADFSEAPPYLCEMSRRTARELMGPEEKERNEAE